MKILHDVEKYTEVHRLGKLVIPGKLLDIAEIFSLYISV